jgi:Restriction endonuclease/NACHT domain
MSNVRPRIRLVSASVSRHRPRRSQVRRRASATSCVTGHADTEYHPRVRALGPGEDAPGKSFEIRVANAYRALGYQVTHNVDLRGKQTDLLARLTPPGSPSITLAIECKDHQAAVGNKIVSDFVSTIIRQRSDNAVTSGALISSSGFTAKGRAVAADYPYITLLSWDDLTAEVIEVRAQMEQLVARYESEPIYGEYLSLNAEVLSWGNLMGPSTKTNALTSLIHEWIQRGAELAAPNALFVLGDFGSGKTTLLRHLEYERARQYLCGQDLHIPLYVTLRNYRDTYDIPQLLRASFRDAYYRDVPSELVWQRIQDGLFYVLLDGFDEMIDRSDAGRRLELFYSLTGLLRSPSPTIITSRPSYFVERGELDDILATLRLEESAIADRRISTSGGASTAADRIRRKLLARRREIQPPLRAYDPLRTQDVGVARLMPLDREQIKAYLHQRAHEMEAVNVTPHAVADFIDRTYDLADLASRPLLLTLIVDSVIDGVLDADDTGTQYGPSGLYEIYTQAKLDLDMSKGRSRREGLSSEARRVLAEAVAIEMYQSQTLEVNLHKTLSELLGTPGIEFDRNNLSRDEIVTDFATCSFVTLMMKVNVDLCISRFAAFS